MYIHYITLGSHTEHVYTPIVKFGCEKVVFIYSMDNDPFLNKEEIKKIKENLENAKKICKELNLPCEFIKLNGSEFYKNIMILKEKIQNEKNKVIVNITGGRKILSLATYVAAASCPNVEKILYYYNNEIILIPKEYNLTKFEQKILDIIKEKPKKITEIAKELNVKKPLISRYVSQLEKKGFIKIIKEGNSKYVKKLI